MSRSRISLAGSMATVALFAVLLAWAIQRPYPTGDTESYASVEMVFWSDGSASLHQGFHPLTIGGNRWLMRVGWPDGGIGFYLTVR